MYCRVVATDFDGTGAADGRLAPELAAALAAARSQGFATLLVTGRVLEELLECCPDPGLFDAVVAENGAVIWLPDDGRRIQIGIPPPDRLLAELRAREIPHHVGAVVVGIATRHAGEALELLQTLGLEGQIVFNRGAAMILPSGINKAGGLRRALYEIGRSPHNLVAYGDAENDEAMLLLAEHGVAAADAVPALAALADEVLPKPGGAAVAHHVHGILERGGRLPTAERHRVVMGRDEHGTIVALPASGANVLIAGDPRSGKSWLAGLVAEKLHEFGYRMCLVDPEGDHLYLGRRPGILVLGHELALPSPGDAARLLNDASRSLILNLSRLDPAKQTGYVEALLEALAAVKRESGLPHWTLIDEAHYFFAEGAPACRHLLDTAGSFLLATYRPSSIASVVHGALGVALVTRVSVEDERYFMSGLLRARGPTDLDVSSAIRRIEGDEVGMLRTDGQGPGWTVFTPIERITRHTHHSRKYADRKLDEERAFHFRETGEESAPVARNVIQFAEAVTRVPASSLRHHLLAGDFSRWASEVLGAESLAAGLRKLERAARSGAPPKAAEVIALLEHAYRFGPEPGTV